MKKRPNSELLQKKWKNNSSERDFFSKHFGLIHLAGLRVLKHFFEKIHLVSSLSLSLHYLVHLLSSFSSSLFYLLFHLVSLLDLVFSLFLCLSSSSCLFSCLASSLFLSWLVSCLASSLFLSWLVSLSLSLSLVLSLSLSFSLCFCLLSLSLSVYVCLCLCVVWCVVWCLRVYVQNASVCRFKTSPCVPAPRAHMLPHAGVVPVHTGTFGIYTRRFLGQTHGGEVGEEGEEREVTDN